MNFKINKKKIFLFLTVPLLLLISFDILETQAFIWMRSLHRKTYISKSLPFDYNSVFNSASHLWQKVKLPDTNWGCNYCEAFYATVIQGQPSSFVFRYASDNTARLYINGILIFDERFGNPDWCSGQPCCGSCCDSPNNCRRVLSNARWHSIPQNLLRRYFTSSNNIIIWRIRNDSGGSGFDCQMRVGGATPVPPVTNRPPEGYLGLANCNYIRGWARDPDTTAPIHVHIYADGPAGKGGRFIRAVRADVYRQDLPFPDKRHGFGIRTPDVLKDGRPHQIYVYGIDDSAKGPNSLLRMSPKKVQCGSRSIPQNSMEWNTDRPGLDFSNFDLPVADPVLCRNSCNSNPRCKAWTYVKPNTIQGPKPRCWLKFAVPKPIPRSCCVSGVK